MLLFILQVKQSTYAITINTNRPINPIIIDRNKILSAKSDLDLMYENTLIRATKPVTIKLAESDRMWFSDKCILLLFP